MQLSWLVRAALHGGEERSITWWDAVDLIGVDEERPSGERDAVVPADAAVGRGRGLDAEKGAREPRARGAFIRQGLAGAAAARHGDRSGDAHR